MGSTVYASAAWAVETAAATRAARPRRRIAVIIHDPLRVSASAPEAAAAAPCGRPPGLPGDASFLPSPCDGGKDRAYLRETRRRPSIHCRADGRGRPRRVPFRVPCSKAGRKVIMLVAGGWKGAVSWAAAAACLLAGGGPARPDDQPAGKPPRLEFRA